MRSNRIEAHQIMLGSDINSPSCIKKFLVYEKKNNSKKKVKGFYVRFSGLKPYFSLVLMGAEFSQGNASCLFSSFTSASFESFYRLLTLHKTTSARPIHCTFPISNLKMYFKYNFSQI